LHSIFFNVFSFFPTTLMKSRIQNPLRAAKRSLQTPLVVLALALMMIIATAPSQKMFAQAPRAMPQTDAQAAPQAAPQMAPQAAPQAVQQETMIESLISPGTRFTGFGGPTVKASPVRGQLGVWTGGYGGVLIDGTFFLGGGGWGLSSDVPASADVAPSRSLAVGYGGIVLEYIANSDKLLHYGGGVFIGWGGAGYVDRNLNSFRRNGNNSFNQDSGFFVVEPSIFGELNLTKWMRLNAGVSYRAASNVRLEGLSNADLSGIAGNLTVKFGAF
jgi:hypothetical protein